MNKKAVGISGEVSAKEYLKKKGYTIISTNEKIAGVEIDILAKKGNLLVLCEVKTRENVLFGQGIESVGYGRQQRYIRSAKLLTARREYENCDVRFDVIEILRDEINHVEDAFRG